MKKNILNFLKQWTELKPGKISLCVWLFYHLSIPLFLFISLKFSGPVGINTSLFDMLPRSRQEKSVRNADMLLGKKNGREAVILCASDEFETAKFYADRLYKNFKNSEKIESITLYYDSSVMEDFYRYLFDYRFMIASDDTLDMLENGEEREIAYDALSGVYGAFNFFSLNNLDKDPFLLAERRIKDLFSSSALTGAMNLKDDVISAEKDGIHYVLLRMTLTPDAVSVRSEKNIIKDIYHTVSKIKKTDYPESEKFEYYFSGVPFHSYESSSGAQKEITLISSITLFLILLLFIFVFRSLSPVAASISAICISIAAAAFAALLVFREIHIITFVFGTTLIGTCVDYSVHYFIHGKMNKNLEDGAKIRSHVIKNITMSFISTQICFIVFLFADFEILKQFAVFSIAGLASSYLTFFCIYPRLKINKLTAKTPVKSVRVCGRVDGKILFIGLMTALIILLIFNSSNIKIKNDISSFYKMSDLLLESEKRAAQVLDYGSQGKYFIVSGSTADETLRNEEKLAAGLKEEVDKGNIASFLATSTFIPSLERQTRTYNAMKNLLPLAQEQFEYLGFKQNAVKEYEREFEKSFNFCGPENVPLQFGISNLWIGKSGENYYSCVMPLKPKDETIFEMIAEDFDFVHFIDKAKDISESLDTITGTMLLLFLIAYIIVSIIIFLVFPFRDGIKICSVPPMLVISITAVHAVNNIPVGFFSAAALVLVFGISLDYIFFMLGKKGSEERKITFLGVTLSFLTTLLSFGALALSGFMPVHIFGLTVCAGLGAAFISAIILQSSVKEESQSNSG